VIDQVTERERQELTRRERLYRGDRPPLDLANKTVILVDDGLATGASMYAAVVALREQRPSRIVVAVPAAAPSACDDFREVVDEIVCAITPEPFYAVGACYQNFSQTTDDEVRSLLGKAEFQ
jgi:predicted phosphoribosyltransferase